LLLDLNETDDAKEYIQAAKHGPIFAEEKRLLEDEVTKISGTSPSPTPSPSPTATSAQATRSTAASPTATPEALATGTP